MHLIAASRTNMNGTEGLSVAFLSGAQLLNISGSFIGVPTVYSQNQQGVWSAAQVITANVQMSSIVGVPNFLIGLGSDRNLYISSFNQTGTLGAPNWSPFQMIPAPTNAIQKPPSGFDDFTAAIGINNNNGASLVVVAVQNIGGQSSLGPQTVDAGFYAWTIDVHNLVFGAGVSLGAWSSIAQTSTGYTGGAFSPALVSLSPNPGVVLAGFLGAPSGWNGNGGLIGFASTNFFTTGLSTWEQSEFLFWGTIVFDMGATAPSIATVAGNPGGQLWTIVPAASNGLLAFSPQDFPLTQWAGTGALLPGNFVATAAALGNVSVPGTQADGTNQNLQAVGLVSSSGIDPVTGVWTVASWPYLVWQDESGNWGQYPVEGAPGTLPNNFNNPMEAQPLYPLDLTTGMGYGPKGQPFLQVPYFASDGNVYLNYQDDSGNWFWYGGSKGQGLP